MTVQYFIILFAMCIKFTPLFKEYRIKPWHFFPLLLSRNYVCFYARTCFDFVCKLICRLQFVMLHLVFDIILAAEIVDLKDLQKSIN